MAMNTTILTSSSASAHGAHIANARAKNCRVEGVGHEQLMEVGMERGMEVGREEDRRTGRKVNRKVTRKMRRKARRKAGRQGGGREGGREVKVERERSWRDRRWWAPPALHLNSSLG